MSTNKFVEVNTKPRGQIFIDNLIGGLAWGVGSVIGATVIIGILGFAIAQSRYVPFVGEIVDIVVDKLAEGRQRIMEYQQTEP
jgi:hypothetical protein